MNRWQPCPHFITRKACAIFSQTLPLPHFSHEENSADDDSHWRRRVGRLTVMPHMILHGAAFPSGRNPHADTVKSVKKAMKTVCWLFSCDLLAQSRALGTDSWARERAREGWFSDNNKKRQNSEKAAWEWTSDALSAAEEGSCRV